MKKKIIKILKTILIMSLLGSFVLPSYAAISASDGSVFVTKGEFDSAMVDFNSRLTTFEAGVNSKIDSQVTSYLETNGIWSAKEQATNNLVFTFKELNDGFVNWLKKTIYDKETSYKMKEGVVIAEVDKGGLCYIEVNWDKSWSSCLYNDKSRHCSFEGGGRGNLTFGKYVYNTSTSKYDIWTPYATLANIASLVGTNYSNSAYYTLAAEKSKVISQFFVRRGDKVEVTFDVTWGGRIDGSGSSSTGTISQQDAGVTIDNVKTSSTSTTNITLMFAARIY